MQPPPSEDDGNYTTSQQLSTGVDLASLNILLGYNNRQMVRFSYSTEETNAAAKWKMQEQISQDYPVMCIESGDLVGQGFTFIVVLTSQSVIVYSGAF